MKTTTIIETKAGLFAAIGRMFERIQIAYELHYLSGDLEYERAHLDALPAKVKALEGRIATLLVQRALLRQS